MLTNLDPTQNLAIGVRLWGYRAGFRIYSWSDTRGFLPFLPNHLFFSRVSVSAVLTMLKPSRVEPTCT